MHTTDQHILFLGQPGLVCRLFLQALVNQAPASAGWPAVCPGALWDLGANVRGKWLSLYQLFCGLTIWEWEAAIICVSLLCMLTHWRPGHQCLGRVARKARVATPGCTGPPWHGTRKHPTWACPSTTILFSCASFTPASLIGLVTAAAGQLPQLQEKLTWGLQ